MLKQEMIRLVDGYVPKSMPKFAIEDYFRSDDTQKMGDSYVFQYPYTWKGIRSPNKSIGLRRANLIGDIYHIKFEIKVSCDGGSTTVLTVPIDFALEYQRPEEFLINLQQKFNAYAEQQNFENLQLRYTYERKSDGSLSCNIRVFDSQEDTYADVKLEKVKVMDLGIKNLNRYLNQPIDRQYDWANSVVFDNVWDRRALYFHADFVSHAYHNLLCRNGESYYKPSKVYTYAGCNDQFRIWYSFDGKTPANLLHEDFELELCFIADIEDNYAVP